MSPILERKMRLFTSYYSDIDCYSSDKQLLKVESLKQGWQNKLIYPKKTNIPEEFVLFSSAKLKQKIG